MEHWDKTSSMEPIPLGRREEKRKLEVGDSSSSNYGQKSAKRLPIIRVPNGLYMRAMDAEKPDYLRTAAIIEIDHKVYPKELRKLIWTIQNGMMSGDRRTSTDQFKPRKLISNHEINSHPPGTSSQQKSILKSNQQCTNVVIARNKVMDILHRFRGYCENLLARERSNPNAKDQNTLKRVDFLAAKMVKTEFRYTDKPLLGPIPGVEIGDKYYYSMELHVLGLHRPPQGGIDYIDDGGRKIAVSIVASGGYDNDWSVSGNLIYCGQGGNVARGELLGEDQKLQGGNLALKNSITAKNPVGVIKGIKAFGSVMYIYEGLYLVEEMWKERGTEGKMVFKFKLVKMPGLSTNLEKKKVRFSED